MHHGQYDLNNITWWLLQTKGVVVYGEPISTLNLNVQWSDVQTTLNYNLNTYWNEKLERDMCFFYDDWIEVLCDYGVQNSLVLKIRNYF